jgi:hypothetical protein
MTIGGVNAIVALGVLAAIGDVARFFSPQKLVSYFGLNPKVRQSDRPDYHGRIAGRAVPTHALCWSRRHGQSRPSPGRYEHSSTASNSGVASRSPLSKLAVLIWHLLTNEEDYAWTRPALMQWKIRELELRPGRASRRGGNKPGPARDYSLKTKKYFWKREVSWRRR